LVKTIAWILAILLLAETAYMLAHRNGPERFQMVDKNVALALDTATGRLCKTIQTRSEEPGDTADMVFVVGLVPCPGAKSLGSWRPTGRFQLVDEEEYGGRIAWDTSTGLLCRTVNTSLLEAYAKAETRDDVARRAKSLHEATTEKDPIFAEIDRASAEADATEDEGVSFTRSLAGCSGIP
jgi:hypothetical protein